VVETALTEGWPQLRPRGTATVYSITQQGSDELVLGDITIRGQVSRFLKGASEVVAFLVTVGSDITELSQQAHREGDIVRSWTFDALGSFAVEAAAETLSRRLKAMGSVSPRYSPGYCGMDLTTQRELFGLFDAKRVRVSLLPSLLMQPMKSISGLLGLGPQGRFVEGDYPCKRCAKVNCSMRR
jgi:cobalamin-dependent methionine synthase I